MALQEGLFLSLALKVGLAPGPNRATLHFNPMANPHDEHELPRVLNVSHATSIVVGIIIGSGIFLVPREMIAAVGSSSMVYVVWIAGVSAIAFRRNDVCGDRGG